MAVEHVLGMLAGGDTIESLLREYAWLEPEDVQACLVYARRLVGHERIEPVVPETVEPGWRGDVDEVAVRPDDGLRA